ncbi:pyridoxamine 5'-phosphate oxidase family protein [Streptomyces sp. NPDC055955]|uniref:pyridoxamine 5'-phosphate oxidase family protein n=1 Tax=Streptomyces sp. NPDC055955 TaxID=3345665 RepID=UPI0035DF8992
MLLGKRGFGVLLTVRRSCCHPHLATVLYRWDSGGRMVWFSAAADRIKVGHLCRGPRVMVHVCVGGGDGVRGATSTTTSLTCRYDYLSQMRNRSAFPERQCSAAIWPGRRVSISACPAERSGRCRGVSPGSYGKV